MCGTPCSCMERNLDRGHEVAVPGWPKLLSMLGQGLLLVGSGLVVAAILGTPGPFGGLWSGVLISSTGLGCLASSHVGKATEIEKRGIRAAEGSRTAEVRTLATSMPLTLGAEPVAEELRTDHAERLDSQRHIVNGRGF